MRDVQDLAKICVALLGEGGRSWVWKVSVARHVKLNLCSLRTRSSDASYPGCDCVLVLEVYSCPEPFLLDAGDNRLLSLRRSVALIRAFRLPIAVAICSSYRELAATPEKDVQCLSHGCQVVSRTLIKSFFFSACSFLNGRAGNIYP